MVFSTDVNELVTNTLLLLLQLLGGISKLVIHTSDTVLQVVSVNWSHRSQSITLLQLPFVDSIDNATVLLNNSTNNAFSSTLNSNNSTEYITFSANN